MMNNLSSYGFKKEDIFYASKDLKKIMCKIYEHNQKNDYTDITMFFSR